MLTRRRLLVSAASISMAGCGKILAEITFRVTCTVAVGGRLISGSAVRRYRRTEAVKWLPGNDYSEVIGEGIPLDIGGGRLLVSLVTYIVPNYFNALWVPIGMHSGWGIKTPEQQPSFALVLDRSVMDHYFAINQSELAKCAPDVTVLSVTCEPAPRAKPTFGQIQKALPWFDDAPNYFGAAIGEHNTALLSKEDFVRGGPRPRKSGKPAS